MRATTIIVAASVTLTNAFDFQLPFKVPFFKTAVETSPDVPTTPRIAIIGAGAGGSSAAFWIARAGLKEDVQVDVYEKNDYIGGRSTTVHPYGLKELDPIELGGSIFVRANKNMWRASQEFNLTLKDFKGDKGNTGFWDGQSLYLTVGDSWWDTLKMIWRYGLNSPRRTDSIVKSVVSRYLSLYEAQTHKFENITTLAEDLDFLEFTSKDTATYFDEQGVSPIFVNEVIEAATRVNYGQNADQIHALEGAVSLAATGATQVEGGNWQIFEHFLKNSTATIHLSTEVTSITRSLNSWLLTSSKSATPVRYDAIILAAPLHQTSIDLPPSITKQVPEQPYVRLHVTLLTTNSSSVNPEYLGLAANAKIPATLLTTYQGYRTGGLKPEFNSLSYHGKVKLGDREEWSVKIFSEEEITKEWLQKVFSGSVGWVHKKVWNAYPKLPPTTTFAPVKLADGFYYVNAFEP